jgi:hypothetical protein
MDPAVIGTIRIGLDAIEAEARNYRALRPAAVRKRRSWPVRATTAAVLRRLAAALDRPPVGEVARQDIGA